jgi:hypothetical protein
MVRPDQTKVYPMSNSEGFENNAVAAIGDDSYIIFSTNGDAEDAFGAISGLVNVKRASGAYVMRDSGKQATETCFIVNARDYNNGIVQDVIHGKRSMPYAKPQESILILGPRATRDAFRPAILQFMDGRPSEFLGYFVNVSEAVARASGQWTEDENGFWIATHDPERAIEESNPAE